MLRYSPILLCFALLSACAGPATQLAPADEWENTIDSVADGIVALRVNVPRAFDTEGTGSFLGTGFVVDLEQGLLLTNRHLVQPGPVVAEAILLNHEEIDLQPVYRDPVHDFGIFRFDPSAVRYMDLAELELAPDNARVGMEIRVIGNDAGEKLAILGGTLARLDRAAPDYGDGFNDFNTFYFQAASDTSGGSSGSPVVGVDGRVVALNAGGSWRSAASFYLPLTRVVRALDLIRTGQPVTRGTIQTIFLHTPFEELSRLGLRPETEDTVRQTRSNEVGMLVVEQVVPEGPASDRLEVGDILVGVNGELVTRFIPLESVLDDNVGGTVTLQVERGGETLDVTLEVADLFGITPDEYVEIGGGILHSLSYQQARNYHTAVSGVYVAKAGYMFGAGGVFDGAVIQTIDGEPIESVDALWTTLTQIPDGQRMTVRYASIATPQEDLVSVVVMDRLWHSMKRCAWSQEAGGWPCQNAPPPPAGTISEVGSTTFTSAGAGPTPTLAPSLVMVEFQIPYRIEGVWGGSFTGAGLVVDAEEGLVVVDRDTVPIGLGDLNIIFGGSLRVPGEVVFIHPLHNLAVVRYEPDLIGDPPVRSAELHSTEVAQGDPVWLIGLDPSYQVASRQTQVVSEAPLILPFPSGRPQHRDINIEAINVEDTVPTLGGVLADEAGRVIALWTSFHVSYADDLHGIADNGLFRGLPVEQIEMILEQLESTGGATYRTSGVELTTTTLADARDLGLSDSWADALEDHDPERRQALTVSRLFAGFPAADVLQGGDMLIAIDGNPITRFVEFDRASQNEQTELTILRDSEEMVLTVDTVPLDGLGIRRVAAWSGLLLHRPHLEVAMQRGIEPNGLYVSWLSYGSPGSSSAVRPTHRIMAVDGVPTPDLDSFFEVVDGREDRSALRLSTLDLEGQPHMITLRLDLQYWPTYELILGEDGWGRVEH